MVSTPGAQPPSFSVHLVGGAVRDALLGLPVQDRDWVVVGATPQDLLDQGFQPVGKDFPVFLHPITHEEFALARTERKTAPGYQGFAFHAAPDVTLEQDLARRDLTINSIATCALNESARAIFDSKNGGLPPLEGLIDPHGGVADLRAGVLRHVGDAFREDPVRILRLARFAARFPHFRVADDTLVLMRQMVADGEVHHLVAERVWQELSRGLMAARPSRMFEVLRTCGALAVLLPELDRLWGVPQRAEYHPEVDTGVHVMLVLDMAAQLNTSLPVRLACLMHDLGKGTTPAHVLPRHIDHEERSAQLLRDVCERWRVPRDCKELADTVAREHGHIHRCMDLSPAALLRLLERCDALRRPERFAEVLLACECDARGRLGKDQEPYPQRPHLLAVLAAAQSVDAGQVARDVARPPGASTRPRAQGEAIAQAIQAARTRAIGQALGTRA
ncbi:multifunctional CCA addition/repair protein [Hydrogenophaga soli]